MAGFLETQSNANQTEAVYIAYFTRAADGGGYLYWTDQFAADESAGLSPAQSAAQISQSFAVQPEATAAYAFLASPPAILSTTDPTQIAAVDSFIIQVYQNLFNRAVTSSDGGVQYWQNQILSGAITVGEAGVGPRTPFPYILHFKWGLRCRRKGRGGSPIREKSGGLSDFWHALIGLKSLFLSDYLRFRAEIGLEMGQAKRA